MYYPSMMTHHLSRAKCIVCSTDIPLVRVGVAYVIVQRTPEILRTPKHLCEKCGAIDSFDTFEITHEEFLERYPDEEYTTQEKYDEFMKGFKDL